MDIRAKAAAIYIAAALVIALFLFVPAGTLDYWQAWMYLASILVPMLFVMAYFLKNDPGFLERRFRTRETEARQQLIVKLALPVFIIGFLLPGLDRRFGWSPVPPEVSIAADALVILGYALVFLVFRENSFAGRTITVEKGQKVISTGPYSMIRHPMYLGALILYLATPIALGSYIALIPFLFNIPVFVLRILNEEEVLARELPGYRGYCGRVRYRLVPYVW